MSFLVLTMSAFCKRTAAISLPVHSDSYISFCERLLTSHVASSVTDVFDDTVDVWETGLRSQRGLRYAKLSYFTVNIIKTQEQSD